MQAIAPKTRIPIHGVPYFGCSWRSRSGIWRCRPIEYTSREHADDARVRRDEEDRRGEQADVDLGRLLERPRSSCLTTPRIGSPA
jgi:hypothetical protein